MSNPMPGQPPAPPARIRPATVTAATWLLLLVAAIYIITAILAFTQASTYMDVYREAYQGTELEDSGEFTGMATAVGGAVFNLLFGIAFVVLALLNHRGKNPARIVTWVVGGISLCCAGLGLALSGAMDSMQFDGQGGPDPAEVQRMVEEAVPDWYFPLTLGALVVSILALLAVLILLALPPSNAFFRKQPPPFEPPPPYPAQGD